MTWQLHCSSTACNISAGLESMGLADVQLLVKLMSLLAVGKVVTGSLVTSVPSRVVSSTLPDPITSEYSWNFRRLGVVCGIVDYTSMLRVNSKALAK